MIGSKDQPHSVWLCPSGQTGNELNEVIADLSRARELPHFDAHVTLLGDLMGGPQDTTALCERVAADLGPVRAVVTDVVRTEAFFMSLFLDLQLDPDLENIRRALGGASEPFRPHLSLAYGPHSDDPLEALRRRFKGVVLELSVLCVVASAKEVPIEDWRILHRIGLARG